MTVGTKPPDGGDEQAFMLWLYQEFKPLMFATARQYGSGPPEDIVQDSLVKLIQKTAVLRGMERPALAVYITYTVRNTAFNLLRRQRLIDAHADVLDEGTLERPAETMPLDELMARKELGARLLEVWPMLSQEEQLLLAGKYIQGLTDQELADQFGCKSASIRMKRTRARRKALQLMMEREGDTP